VIKKIRVEKIRAISKEFNDCIEKIFKLQSLKILKEILKVIFFMRRNGQRRIDRMFFTGDKVSKLTRISR
jgi:hypothetical protein